MKQIIQPTYLRFHIPRYNRLTFIFWFEVQREYQAIQYFCITQKDYIAVHTL
jgi:hypothetical protein